MGKKLIWMPLPEAPAEFYEELRSIEDETAFFEYLAAAAGKGWIEIFGVTDKDPRDIVAQLQEHFKVLYVKGE
jgi:hypothetical protein